MHRNKNPCALAVFIKRSFFSKILFLAEKFIGKEFIIVCDAVAVIVIFIKL